MTSLVADDAMLAVLGQAKGLAEIRDSNGKVIGFFAPVALEKAHLYAEAAARIDPVEMHRREQDRQPGHTTEEVLERLNKKSWSRQ
jgi:hypothetical protein